MTRALCKVCRGLGGRRPAPWPTGLTTSSPFTSPLVSSFRYLLCRLGFLSPAAFAHTIQSITLTSNGYLTPLGDDAGTRVSSTCSLRAHPRWTLASPLLGRDTHYLS